MPYLTRSTLSFIGVDRLLAIHFSQIWAGERLAIMKRNGRNGEWLSCLYHAVLLLK